MATFQPPIHLDPNQDPSQQTAFINQNFQSLAASLESNSFRIVTSVPLTLTFTISSSNYSSFVSSAPHGQTSALPFIAPLTIDPTLFSSFGGLPQTQFMNKYTLNVAGGTPKTLLKYVEVTASIDSTKVYLIAESGGITGGPFTCSTLVYVLQQPF